MRKKRVAIIDLLANGTSRNLFARVMYANLAGIMPQAIAVWCERDGHEVDYVFHTGFEDLMGRIPDAVDIAFIAAFTQGAHLAIALSRWLRSRGTVTVLGGPHARCYPRDSLRHFDYVVGFTDRELVRSLLADGSPQRPLGMHLTASGQPASLPGVRERWKYVERTQRNAPLLKIVAMLGSTGCPNSCDFCVDAHVPYQAMDLDQIQEDLRFLRRTVKCPKVLWYDPNFGVHLDETVEAIQAAGPPGSFQFAGECNLALLSDANLTRLQSIGFQGLFIGVESWYAWGAKARVGATVGMEKVRRIAEDLRRVQARVPYVQANFILGLDHDRGPEPFSLAKRFADLAPGVFPSYVLFTAFGRASRLNEELRRAGRILPFPYHFLDVNHGMNVRPLHYSWPRFYDHVIDVTSHAFSMRAISRRFREVREPIPRWMNVIRGMSLEGRGIVRYYRQVRRRLESDPEVRRFFEQETVAVPHWYVERIHRALGPLRAWLPAEALEPSWEDYEDWEPEPLTIERAPTPGATVAEARG